MPAHVPKDWERIRALDLAALPLIPAVGIDAAYRIALAQEPHFTAKAKPPSAKKQGELFLK